MPPVTSTTTSSEANSDDDEDSSSSILYELLELCEWHTEYRAERAPAAAATSGLRAWAGSLLHAPQLPAPLLQRAASQSSWQLCLSGDGALLALLQPALLEVRTARDNFTSLAASVSIAADPQPALRRLCWSAAAETPLLVVADSDGTVRVYDALATPVCQLETPPPAAGAGPVCGLVVTAPAQSRWNALVLVVHYSALVAAHHVSADGAHEPAYTATAQCALYPRGITSCTWDNDRQLLVLAGASCQLGAHQLQGLASCEGVTCWRLLPEYPHLRGCQSQQERDVRAGGGWLPWRRGHPAWDTILSLSLSPSGRRLVSVHDSGALTIWQFPGMRRESHWPLQSQPGHDAVSPQILRLPTARRLRRLSALGTAASKPAQVTWWSEAALIVARRSGAVTVCRVDTLHNLLGESAEFFGTAAAPRVTSARASADGGQAFLVLQRELRRAPRVNSDSSSSGGGGGGAAPATEEPSSQEEEEEEEFDEEHTPASLPQRLVDGVRWGLHWVTDSERFEVSRRRCRPSRLFCRLTGLRSTTPQQLYARKVELGQYSEALLLAEAYHLDSDLVYLRQWQTSAVSADSIGEFLARIERRAVVLAECAGRVPETLAGAHALLTYGLSGTDLEAALDAADPGRVNFQPCDPRRCYQDLPVDQLAMRERQLRRQLLVRLGPADQLQPAQRQLLLYRRQLLRYRDRLRTYECMLGGGEAAEKKYQPAVYSRFRDRTALDAALELARGGDWRSLQVMLRYHGDELAEHRLLLLANLPETTTPALYAPLLPEADASGRVVAMETERWEEPDWVDNILLDGGSPRHRPSAPGRPAYVTAGAAPALEALTAWYAGRAEEVVQLTGLVGHGLELLRLGTERNVPGLGTLKDQMLTMEALVYDAGHAELTLDGLRQLSAERVMTLLMADTDHSTFVSHFGSRLLPFLARQAPAESAQLLRNYLLANSSHSLKLIELLVAPPISKSKAPPARTQPLVADVEQLATLALDAVQACTATDSIDAASRIVAALTQLPLSSPLRERCDLWRLRLQAVPLLHARQQRPSPAELQLTCADAGRVRALLQRMCHVELTAATGAALAEPDWRRLLDDMLELQQKVFQVVSPQVCHETLVLALLNAGQVSHIRLAGRLIETEPTAESAVSNVYLRRLPYAASVELVVRAAEEYFDSASSLVDPAVQLARHCLQLMGEPAPAEVRRERGLLDSLDVLLDLGVSLLPVQVRRTPDKLRLVTAALDARPDAYRRSGQLQQLCQLLEMKDSWRLWQLVCERALAAGDPAAAARACGHLAGGQHTAAWQHCRQVAEAEQFGDVDTRLSLLSFCLAHCPVDQLEPLLNLRHRLLAIRLSNCLSPVTEDQPDTPDGEKVAQKATSRGDMKTKAEENKTDSTDREEDRTAKAGERLNEEQEDIANKVTSDDEGIDVDVEEPDASRSVDDPDAMSGVLGVGGLTLGLTGHLVRATASSARAVMQATQQTSRALVRGQLPAGAGELLSTAGAASRGLLRSTVARLTHPQQGDDGAPLPPVDDNAAVRRLGVSAFSADLTADSHRSVLEVPCGALSPPEAIPEQLAVAVSAVRLWALQATAEARPPQSPPVQLVGDVARCLLPEDAALAVAWTIVLPAEELVTCLNSWPGTELSLQLAQYSCALHMSSETDSKLPPQQLISDCMKQLPATSQQLAEQLQNLERRLQLAKQAAHLLALDPSVDVERFSNDADYRRDTILGLTMCDDDVVLTGAARLAEQYDVSPTEMAREQIVYLLTSDLSCDEVRERLRRRQLKSEALKQPDQLADALERRALPAVAGEDHPRLLLTLTLLTEAAPERADAVSARCTLLQLLVSTGADFHRLLTADGAQLTTLLSAAVSALTLEPLQELAPRLGNAALTASTVTAAWLRRSLADTPPPDWLDVLKSETENLRQLNHTDFVHFGTEALFSDAALKLGLDVRQEMAATMRCAADAREPGEEWDRVRETLDGWTEHLEYMEWEDYQELLEESDDDIYRLARLFDQTRGESVRLRDLRARMVTDHCHLSTIRRILSVYPLHEAVPLGRALLSTLSEVAAALSRDQTAEELTTLQTVAEQLRLFIDTDGDGVALEQIIDEFRKITDNDQLPGELRLRVGRLGGALFAECRDQFPSVVRADTAAALPPDTPLSAADTASPEGRLALLTRLAADADADMLSRLASLLTQWPQFAADVSADPRRSPLCALTARALQLDPAAAPEFVLRLARQHAGTARLPPPAHARLVSQLWQVAPPAALQVALLSRDAAVRTDALLSAAQTLSAEQPLPAAAAARGWPLDAATLDLVVTQGALPLTVGTALHSPCVERLVDTCDLEFVSAAAEDLRQAGHGPEAAALMLQARSAAVGASSGANGTATAAASTINAARHAAKTVFSKWLQ